MTQNKNILIIGLDPHTVDFSQEGFIKGLTAEKVLAQTEAEVKRLAENGYDSELCWINAITKDTARLVEQLKNRPFDAVMIGAGIRAVQQNFIAFETIVNIVHEFAPITKITFNTNPMDTMNAIKRWI